MTKGLMIGAVLALEEEEEESVAARLAPNMLKNLPIIPSRTSQNFYLLFIFIPIASLLCQ